MELTREQILDALRQVMDPEVGMDVVTLGLVYGVTIEGGTVQVDLTMTTPACPLGEHITEQAASAVRAVPGVQQADVRLVWEPRWTPERMSPEARQKLGWGA